MQKLLRYICENGFEHHTAINLSQCAASVNEAFSKYLAGAFTTTMIGKKPGFSEKPGSCARSEDDMAKYAIGVDFGTESGRACWVDVADGREVATAVHPTPTA